MKKIQTTGYSGRPGRGLVKAGLAVTLLLFLSGCYFTSAVRDFQAGRGAPWWCQGTPDLNQQECQDFSAYVDLAILNAHKYPTYQDALNAGASTISGAVIPVGWGVGVVPPGAPAGAAALDAGNPNVLLYNGNSPSSRLAGVAWRVNSGALPPVGFPGDRDVWAQHNGLTSWWLPAWVIRGYENHPNVFAASHPCLATGVTLGSTSDACFLASHTEPFEVLVTNDDGVEAEGIDHVVEALYGLSNITVHVVAPAENQSGSSDRRTGSGYNVTAAATTTLSGKVATEVFSDDPARPLGSGSPADAVIYALRRMYLSPDLVVSGTNEGQNIGTFSALSGTVGAARTALRQGVDAIATSTGGIIVTPDFTTGSSATMVLIEQWRLGLAGAPYMEAPSINIPSCAAGLSIQGTVETVVAPDNLGRTMFGQAAQDCTPVVPAPTLNDDVDAFNHGYISITDVGKNSPPNWP